MMDNIEELIKFKELLDQGIISQDEFAVKKAELLGDCIDNNIEDKVDTNKATKKGMTKNTKMILTLLSVIILFVILFFVITKTVRWVDNRTRINAAAEALERVMSEYGLSNYKVIYVRSDGTGVLCPEFEELSSSEKYEFIKDTMRLSDITIKGDEIDLSCVVYVNKRDYYYYISPLWANDSRNNYNCGGIYKYDGNRYCIYEEY